MKRHADHAFLSADPLVVKAVIHCGQERLIEQGGPDTLSRVYRVEPDTAEGRIVVTLDLGTNAWSVRQTFGAAIDGKALVNATALAGCITGAKNWKEVEDGIATYFQCCVYEFSEDAAGGRRLRASPVLDHVKPC